MVMAPVASSLASELSLLVKIDYSFTTDGKIVICLTCNRSVGCSMKSVGATYTKCTTYREQTTEFFEEASVLNKDAAIFDLRKRILQGYVQLDGVREHPLV
jgi:hypothetical protein